MAIYFEDTSGKKIKVAGVGPPGKSATINGVSALNIDVTGGITGTMDESTYRIDGSSKQEKLVGENGQIVKFDENGEAKAENDYSLFIPQGGTASMPEGTTGPYTIEFTEDEEFPVTADNVSYKNNTSGLMASNVQEAIDELFTSVSEGKSLIAAAVTGKGIETAADATFQQIAENVTAIKGDSTSALFSIDNKSGFSLPSEAQAGEWVVSTNRIDTMAALINITDELGNNIPFNFDINGPNTQVSTLAVSGYKLSFIMPLSNIEIIQNSGGTGEGN